MGGTLLVRRFTASLLLVGLALGTSGCSLTGNVASLDMYAPSDGQQVDLEAIKARNFMYLVADSGAGYLIGSLVNISNEDRVVKLQYPNPETGGNVDIFYEVAANSKLDFGYNGNPAMELQLVGKPGQTALVYVLESDSSSAGMRVPILDGTLAEYRLLLEQLEANSIS